jgi:hypothetical protein
MTAYRQATVDVHEKVRQSHDYERRTAIGCPVSVYLGDESFTELVVKSFSVGFHEEVVNVSMLYRRGSMTKRRLENHRNNIIICS